MTRFGCFLMLFSPFLTLFAAESQNARFEAGFQVGALDERDALSEKPAIAGGRVSVRALRFLDAEAEVNRFPVGGSSALFPGTQFLFGAKAGYRTGAFGIFGKVRPGFIRFDSDNLNAPALGTRPAVDVGIVLEFYSRRHLFARVDFGDTVVSYGSYSGFGTKNQFQGTFGAGVWF